MGRSWYLHKRMYTKLIVGENLHLEVATLIPQHPYATRKTS